MSRGEMAEKLAATLMEFVERAAKENSTEAEVKALPEVAQVLKNLIVDFV